MPRVLLNMRGTRTIELNCETCNKTFKRFLCHVRSKHAFCGKKCFSKWLSDLRKGDKNPMWKGNYITKRALHRWVKRNKPPVKFCERCKKVTPLDLANISQKYKKDIDDYEWLCRKCHMEKDGRILKFLEIARSKIGPYTYWNNHTKHERNTN